MTDGEKRRFVFDPLLGKIEDLVDRHCAEVLERAVAISAKIPYPIHEELTNRKWRSAQFNLVHEAIALGETLFQQTCDGLPKEIVMAIARRAPESFLDGADNLLATLIVKYGAPAPGGSWSFTAGNTHALALSVTWDDVRTVCDLMAIAKTMDRLRGMARWLGKGGKLTTTAGGALLVDLPDAVKTSVDAYERRRVRGRLFDSIGFFSPEPEPAKWSQHRIPILVSLGSTQMLEAPIGSDRWLSFERFATMRDGGGLTNILRAYEAPLVEVFGVGTDVISHSLTALAVLIHSNTPRIIEKGGHLAFAVEATRQATEQMIGFSFGLARKGFLRFPKAYLIHHLGLVRTPFAPDQAAGERLASAFIDAFLMPSDAAPTIDPIAASAVPFLHQSTEDYIYVDLLLIGDFLSSIVEAAKDWYASQHGDHFLLDLKHWLDEAVPGAIINARRPIKLENGAISDIDLLARDQRGLVVIECKAFSKSRAFFIGSPNAVTQRRGRFRSAMAQAERISETLARDVAAGATEFSTDLAVRPLVCSPTAEFLLPFDELGLERADIPRVVTPEELFDVLTRQGGH